MEKKNLLIIPVLLSLINFTSAAYYYGNYGNGALSEFLNRIDASTMILGFVFILCFFFVFTGLSGRKTGKQNRAGAGIIAFMIALFVTWGVNKTGFDFEGLFFDLGISADFLYTIIPLILLGLIIFLGIKFNFRIVLMVLGGLLIFSGFTDLFYQKGTIVFVGIILFAVGLIWQVKKRGGNELAKNLIKNIRKGNGYDQGELMDSFIKRTY